MSESLPPNPPCNPFPYSGPPNPPNLFSAGPVGPAGQNGINNGLVCLSGTGAPSNTLGADGDLYVDTAALALYGPRTAGVWIGPIGAAPSGAAGGVLSGTYPNPTLAAVVSAGTYEKVTVNTGGQVTSGGPLSPSDIPGGVELQANKDVANGYAGLDASVLLKTAEFPAFTGVVTTTAGGTVTAYTANSVSNSVLTQMAANTVKANLTGSTANAQDVTLSALGTALSLAVTAVKTVKRQVIASSGTYTPSTGMLYCIAEVQGGGAGGGGAAGTASQSAAGGGGGGGGYATKVFAAATIGSSQTVTVGGTAAGGSAGNNNGTNGNASSIGSLLSATGGVAGNGAASSATFSGATGGAGGTGSSGDYNLAGGAGGNGFAFGSNTSGIGGYGGSSHFAAPSIGSSVTGAGNVGVNYGGGGSGGAAGASSTAGGAGAQGVIIITEFCSQ